MNNIVNGLWIQGELSALELLTIKSFLANGFQFYLWTYTPGITNAPKNTILKDANEIIPFDDVFSYNHLNKHGFGKGSYAGFSDIFRYKLLYENGGIWSDMDITCLKPFELKDDYFFRFHHKVGAVGNFMKCPKGSAIMQWCYAQAIEKINAGNTNWMLPIEILNDGISTFNLANYIQKISNNDSFPEVAKLLTSCTNTTEDWKIIHWMNEEFRRQNISKNKCIPNSTISKLYNKYEISHQVYSGVDLLKNKILLSRYYYLLRNIKSTLAWYVLPR